MLALPSSSPPPSPPPPPSDGLAKQPIKTNTICQVCGEDASINNYGALSCLSCRTFFRRNALPSKDLIQCRYDGQCDVNILTRKVCASCRLAKCLSAGMSSDFIRKEDLSGRKRKLSKSKNPDHILTTIPKQSALDLLLDGDGASLSASDWTIISNVVHAFDTFSPVSKIRRIIENINTSTTSDPQIDISQSFQFMSTSYSSLQSFISSTPDFKVLTENEQCSLFQRNMIGLLCVGGMYLMRESGLFDKPENEMIILPFYGSEVIQQVKFICQQLSCDAVVFKLMLIALAFSSNCYTIPNRRNMNEDSLLFGTFRLLGSQNVYVELMWRYLIHNYSYTESVQKFSTLIKQLLDTLKLSIDVYENNKVHQAFIDGTIEQAKTSCSINEQAIIPLWGKQP